MKEDIEIANERIDSVVDEYGLSYHTEDAMSGLEYVFDKSYEAVGDYSEMGYQGTYSGDRGIGEALVSLVMNHEPWLYLPDLLSYIQKKQEEVEEEFYIIEYLGAPFPMEEDFETQEEYKDALEEYERLEQEWYNDNFPFGWFFDIYKEVEKQLKLKYGINLEEFYKLIKGQDEEELRELFEGMEQRKKEKILSVAKKYFDVRFF